MRNKEKCCYKHGDEEDIRACVCDRERECVRASERESV
jgi:hypothetical protein